MRELEDKIAVITGAATEIGAACALALAEKGAQVILADVSEQAEKTAISLKDSGYKAEHITFDQLSEQDIKKAVSHIIDKIGFPSVVINCPQEFEDTSLQQISSDDWSRVIDENLKGYFLFCKHIVPKMMESGSGSIINIASITAERGIPGSGASACASGGVISLTKAMAAEYASGDIRANAIITGMIKTEKYREARLKKEPEYEKKLIRHIPMGRLGRPEEVASAAVFLAGKAASYITGSAIMVDGGYNIY